jgi:hypothetical protein
MTFLEKAKELFPNLAENEIIEDICPGEIFIEDFSKFKNCEQLSFSICEQCWTREMPEVKNE